MSRKPQAKEISVVDSLYRISSLVGDTEDPKEAFTFILDEIMEVLGATSASIALIHPESNQLRLEVYRGLPESAAEWDLKLGQGITGWAAFMGKPVLVGDVREDPRYVAVRDNIRSEMVVPMEDGGNVIGVVNVDSTTVNAFKHNDLKILTLLTNEATRVVTKLWMIRKLRNQADQLQSLINTAQRLVDRHDLEDILNGICLEARRLMEYPMAAIFLTEDNGQSLRLHSLYGRSGPITFAEKLRLEESSMGAAVRRKKQVEVFDLAKTEEHHFIPLIQREGLFSMLATPLVYETRVIGVLNVYTAQSHRFSNTEKSILRALSSLGAVAIQNTRFYTRMFESEAKLHQNERLTTLGLLAAEIAHEIRNPLTVLKLLFDSMDLQFEADDARAQDLQVMSEKIDQLAEIVDRVLNFGKNRQEIHSRWTLQTIVEETLRLSRFKLNQSRVELETEIPEKALYVDVHKGQIQQALLNLIVNAVEAMPEGGHIRLRLGYTPGEGKALGQNWLELTDTGTGIPEKIQGSIFESFLTAKKTGTGLGLSIVKRIVRGHRGDIELVRSSGEGTTFRLWLPAVRDL